MKNYGVYLRTCFGLAGIFFGLGLYALAAVKTEHRCAKLMNDSCTDTGSGRCGLRLEHESKCVPTSGADKAECFYCHNTTTKITSKVCLYSPGGSCTTTTETFNCAPDDSGTRVGACESPNASTCTCTALEFIPGDPRCSQTKTYNGCSG